MNLQHLFVGFDRRLFLADLAQDLRQAIERLEVVGLECEHAAQVAKRPVVLALHVDVGAPVPAFGEIGASSTTVSSSFKASSGLLPAIALSERSISTEIVSARVQPNPLDRLDEGRCTLRILGRGQVRVEVLQDLGEAARASREGSVPRTMQRLARLAMGGRERADRHRQNRGRTEETSDVCGRNGHRQSLGHALGCRRKAVASSPVVEPRSALARLEAPLRLVDDVEASLAPHETIVAVARAQRFQRVPDLHGTTVRVKASPRRMSAGLRLALPWKEIACPL